MSITFSSISRFFRDRAAVLRRIVWASRGEVQAGDVESEAWLIATDIGAKRGRTLDLQTHEDQETLLGALYNRLVKFTEKHLRYAVKLDTDWDKEDSTSYGAALSALLEAPAMSDPAIRALHEEQGHALVEAVRHSYSEASAYVLLLIRFEWDAPELASHLRVGLATFRHRLKRSGTKAKEEPSLFDGVEAVDRDFPETIERPVVGTQRSHLTGDQWGWAF